MFTLNVMIFINCKIQFFLKLTNRLNEFLRLLNDKLSFWIDERRSFTEAPIPGYKGFVPRNEEHKLGSRYSVWTRNAYENSLGTRLREETARNQHLDVSQYKTTQQQDKQ